jgi:hypothetical protein
MATKCSGRRSFSQLKRIKNELQTSLLQKKLIIMGIENDKLHSLSCDDIIHNFAL